jgi:hypothetical protein
MTDDDHVHRSQSEMENVHTDTQCDDRPIAEAPLIHDTQAAQATKAHKRAALPPPSHPKPIPCPRCGSEATKFCYYNNHDPQQPRYYCKDCQRYWTVGGVLRNVPPGSGRRKSRSAASRENRRAAASNLAAAVEPSTASTDPAANVKSGLMYSNPLASMLMSNLGLGGATVSSFQCGRHLAEANSMEISNQTGTNTQCLPGPASSLSNTNMVPLLVTPSLLAHYNTPMSSKLLSNPQQPADPSLLAVSDLIKPSALQPTALAWQGPVAQQQAVQRAPSAFTQHNPSATQPESAKISGRSSQCCPSAFTQHTRSSPHTRSTESLIPQHWPPSTGTSSAGDGTKSHTAQHVPAVPHTSAAAAAEPSSSSAPEPAASAVPAHPLLQVQTLTHAVVSQAAAAPLRHNPSSSSGPSPFSQNAPSVSTAASLRHESSALPGVAPLNLLVPPFGPTAAHLGQTMLPGSAAAPHDQQILSVPAADPLVQNCALVPAAAPLSQTVSVAPAATPLGQNVTPAHVAAPLGQNIPFAPAAGSLQSVPAAVPLGQNVPSLSAAAPLGQGVPPLSVRAPPLSVPSMPTAAYPRFPLPGNLTSSPHIPPAHMATQNQQLAALSVPGAALPALVPFAPSMQLMAMAQRTAWVLMQPGASGGASHPLVQPSASGGACHADKTAEPQPLAAPALPTTAGSAAAGNHVQNPQYRCDTVMLLTSVVFSAQVSKQLVDALS